VQRAFGDFFGEGDELGNAIENAKSFLALLGRPGGGLQIADLGPALRISRLNTHFAEGPPWRSR